MRPARLLSLCAVGLVLTTVSVWTQPPSPAGPKSLSSVPLVLAGGTVVDVTNWGRSANDLRDAVVVMRDGRITDVGSRMAVSIPKGARVIDCTGKFLIPGLIDGFAGMNSQGIQTQLPSKRKLSTSNWSHLASRPEWALKLREGAHPAELSPDVTLRQLTETARLGTRAILLGRDVTAANVQWIIARAHQLGLATYGEFVSTPYKVGVEAGVDALPRMDRYDLGVIPDELEQPLVEDSAGAAAATAYDYAERLPSTDLHLRAYARLLAAHHAALMPAFSLHYAELPGHRNLWKEPVAALLDPARVFEPTDRATGEMIYPLPPWTRRLPAATLHWMEESQRKKAEQSALRLWQINKTIFYAHPHYLAASGAPVYCSLPGISMHTELELLVRLGLSPREALAAATNNYSLQFGWNELGQIAPGRRADILLLDADPTRNIWNARRIAGLILNGNPLDREKLLNSRH